MQDVLLEHQMHVGKVFNQKVSDQNLAVAECGCGDGSDGGSASSTNTPTDIGEMEEKVYGSAGGGESGSMQYKTYFSFPTDS